MDPSARTLALASLCCVVAANAHALPIDGFREGGLIESAGQPAPPVAGAMQRPDARGASTSFGLGPVRFGTGDYISFDFDLPDHWSAGAGDFSVEFYTGN